jgi:hypothetical protein
MPNLQPVNCDKRQYTLRFLTFTTVVIIVLGICELIFETETLSSIFLHNTLWLELNRKAVSSSLFIYFAWLNEIILFSYEKQLIIRRNNRSFYHTNWSLSEHFSKWPSSEYFFKTRMKTILTWYNLPPSSTGIIWRFSNMMLAHRLHLVVTLHFQIPNYVKCCVK